MADLITQWRTARAEWAAADVAGASVRVCNRMMDRIWSLAHQIAADPSLHSLIEDLCGPDRDADLRVGAALVREHWDVRGAAETLMSVIQQSGGSIGRPVTMSSALAVKSSTTARTAALCLLNIDSGRGNTGTNS